MIQIKELQTKRDLRAFAKYPVKLYKNCPYYVPSLRSDEMNTFNPDKNFSLKVCDAKGFLAYKDGKIVGRIVGIINKKDIETTGVKAIRFSRFECIDDMEVFKALLGAVEKYGKQNGLNVIHGPWGFDDTDREGMLTFGFNERSTYATNYYYPYFSENLRKLGYGDESKWVERRFAVPDKPYERIVEFAKKIQERYGFKEITEGKKVKEIAEKYGDKMFETYNQSYSALDGFVPVEGRRKENVLSQFATIANARYVSFVVDKNDNVAAFGIVLPSICNALIKHRGKLFPTGFIGVLKSIKKPKDLEMALIGVRDEYRNTGVNAMVISHIMKNVIEDGVENIESNPMLETNYNIQHQWKFAESKIIKKRQTFIKEIDVAE